MRRPPSAAATPASTTSPRRRTRRPSPTAPTPAPRPTTSTASSLRSSTCTTCTSAPGTGSRESDGTDRRRVHSPTFTSRRLGTGLYGYCAPEGSGSARDRKAYCVLDDDYTGFPRTQLENVQVTAAHEYFHAVQYAYDATEASWFMEATATWAEDEVYDAVNDNVQYLRAGQLGRPDLPLDRSYTNGNHYGNWIFFRYLTEKYRASAGGMPTAGPEHVDAVPPASPASRPWSTPSRPPAATSPRCTPGSPTPTAGPRRRTPRARRSGTRPPRWPSAPSSSRPGLRRRPGARCGWTTCPARARASSRRRRRRRSGSSRCKSTWPTAPAARSRWSASTSRAARWRSGNISLNAQGQGRQGGRVLLAQGQPGGSGAGQRQHPGVFRQPAHPEAAGQRVPLITTSSADLAYRPQAASNRLRSRTLRRSHHMRIRSAVAAVATLALTAGVMSSAASGPRRPGDSTSSAC